MRKKRKRKIHLLQDLHLCSHFKSKAVQHAAAHRSSNFPFLLRGSHFIVFHWDNCQSFKWKGFLSAPVITRYAARVWRRRGEVEKKKKKKTWQAGIKIQWVGQEGSRKRDVLKQREWKRAGGREAHSAALASVWGWGRTCLWSEGWAFFSFFFWSGRAILCQVPKTHLLLGNPLQW